MLQYSEKQRKYRLKNYISRS